ncbi:MAG: dihydroorotate dehydrogenase electron transfer subunit [candidate division WOR-3 bacterium]|nr:dihydroorotate dehydrogenase electron transfer subunit [candidate division WOR-3 bacterium]
MATARIIENERITPLIFRMVLEEERIARETMPGQFVNLRIGDGYYPLLRRPMSVHYTDGDRFAILYNVRGIGTNLLSTYRKGDQIDVLGPLGKPFDLPPSSENLYLIAGGMGIAPLYFLYREAGGFLIMGARNKDGILPVEEMEYGRSDFPVATVTGKREERRAKREGEKRTRTTNTIFQIVTEDGSVGEKGLVTDYLPDVSSGSTIVTCGPISMLEKVKVFYSHREVTCILSLEARMGCGYGVCLSCAVKTKNGYKYVCKDGPAFRAEDVEFDHFTPSPSIS